MRSGFAVGLAVISFGLGAWLSPRLAAQNGSDFIPLRPEEGQQIILSRPDSTSCNVERVRYHWVLCKGPTQEGTSSGMWRNLTNGAGYIVQVKRN